MPLQLRPHPPRARHAWVAVLMAALLSVSPGPSETARADWSDDPPAAVYRQRRDAMVDAIARMAADWPVHGRSGIAARVLEALRAVPRHRLVPESDRPHAYENRPLPIGYGQTISQPYIVALMTDLLDVEADAVVLEVGTGSGYQAAVLAELVRHVYTVEIIEPLAARARRDLAAIGADTVTQAHRDGYYGWPEHGPFDAIIVTAAATHIPPPLVRQLKPGGRMVIPVGAQFLTQYLTLVTKDADGRVDTDRLLPVRFVPLTGGR